MLFFTNWSVTSIFKAMPKIVRVSGNPNDLIDLDILQKYFGVWFIIKWKFIIVNCSLSLNSLITQCY